MKYLIQKKFFFGNRLIGFVLIIAFMVSQTACSPERIEKMMVRHEALSSIERLPSYSVIMAEGYLLLENRHQSDHLIPLDLLTIIFGDLFSQADLLVEAGDVWYLKKEALQRIPQLQVHIDGQTVEIFTGERPALEQMQKMVPATDPLSGYLFLVDRAYPLPADFENPGLALLESPYVKNYHQGMVFEQEAARMLGAMAADFYQQTGRKFINVSTYRTFEHQQRIFNSRIQMNQSRFGMTYQQAYDTSAEIVAIPGTSEHQSGLAIDFSTQELLQQNRPLVEGFANTIDGIWLAENAAHYGFMLSFPKGKTEITNIVYEPWHYRYVGLPHSKIISDNQMVLSEYLEALEAAGVTLWESYRIYYFKPEAFFIESISYPSINWRLEPDNRGGLVLTKDSSRKNK